MIAAGRWNRVGRPITYLADSSALAMLEVLVHLDVAAMPPPFQLIAVDAPPDLALTDWPADQDATDMRLTSDWGDAFLRANRSALARVPSVVAPGGWNLLLNPLHADAARMTVAGAQRWPWDARLFAR